MGASMKLALDIAAYATLTKPSICPACHRHFEEDKDLLIELKQTDPIQPFEPGIYTGTPAVSFHVGGYQPYYLWRGALSRCFWDMTMEEIADVTRSGPFIELINFVDDSGVLGTELVAKLAKDFSSYREEFAGFLRSPTRYGDRSFGRRGEEFIATYDRFARAMKVASTSGIVRFH